MLALKRQSGQSIDLYDSNGARIASVVVKKVDDGECQVGISALPGITILRSEVRYDAGKAKDGTYRHIPEAAAAAGR